MSASAATAVLESLREQVRAAVAARQPLRLRGAGTKDFYGEACVGTPLELRSLAGIVDYDPCELVITARCGTALSELESTLATRGIYATDPARCYMSAYDDNQTEWSNTAKQWAGFFGTRPWLSGGFVWTGFDYKGEPSPYG